MLVISSFNHSWNVCECCAELPSPLWSFILKWAHLIMTWSPRFPLKAINYTHDWLSTLITFHGAIWLQIFFPLAFLLFIFPQQITFRYPVLKEALSTCFQRLFFFLYGNNGELTSLLKYFVASLRGCTRIAEGKGASAHVEAHCCLESCTKPLNLPEHCEGLYLFPSTDICLWKYCRENATGSSNLRLKGRIFWC